MKFYLRHLFVFVFEIVINRLVVSGNAKLCGVGICISNHSLARFSTKCQSVDIRVV